MLFVSCVFGVEWYCALLLRYAALKCMGVGGSSLNDLMILVLTSLVPLCNYTMRHSYSVNRWVTLYQPKQFEMYSSIYGVVSKNTSGHILSCLLCWPWPAQKIWVDIYCHVYRVVCWIIVFPKENRVEQSCCFYNVDSGVKVFKCMVREKMYSASAC